MEWFANHSLCLAEPDLVLHLGAGRGSELDIYKQFSRSRILLVEPQAELAGKLRARAASMSNASVLQVAVAGSDEPGPASLKRFNLAEFSSLYQPTGLKSLFPGLREIGTVRVDTVMLKDLVREQGVERSGENWLVLDAPGLESAVVVALAKDSLANSFTHIFIRTGREPMYEGADGSARLLERFADLGYELLGNVDETDPDVPRFHLVLNRAALKATEVNAQLTAQYDEELSKHDERIVELRQALLEANSMNEQLAAQHAEELSKHDERIVELRQALLEANSMNEQLAAQHHSDLVGRDRRLAELEADITQARIENQALSEFREESKTELVELRSAVDRAKADLTVALRTQALRDADLKDLQSRYADVVVVRDKQHELLVKLRQRLGSAAQYLQQVEAEGVAVGDAESGRDFVPVAQTVTQEGPKA